MKDDFAGGMMVMFFIWCMVAIFIALIVATGCLNPTDYCPAGFERTELVLHENGTWSCEE